VILRFTPGATAEQREAVAAAVRAAGSAVLATDGILSIDPPLDEGQAVPIAALPGVAALLARDPRAPTLRDQLLRTTGAACFVLGLLVLVAAHHPARLAGPADPLHTPGDLQPFWPLLAWYGVVNRAPGWVPVSLLPLLGGLVLLGWPLIARPLAERRPRWHTALGAAAVAAYLALALVEATR